MVKIRIAALQLPPQDRGKNTTTYQSHHHQAPVTFCHNLRTDSKSKVVRQKKGGWEVDQLV